MIKPKDQNFMFIKFNQFKDIDKTYKLKLIKQNLKKLKYLRNTSTEIMERTMKTKKKIF